MGYDPEGRTGEARVLKITCGVCGRHSVFAATSHDRYDRGPFRITVVCDDCKEANRPAPDRGTPPNADSNGTLEKARDEQADVVSQTEGEA